MKKMYIIRVSFSAFIYIVTLAGIKAQHVFQTDLFQPHITIDNFVHAFMTENNVPGLSLSISKDEKIVYSKGYGYADREAGSRITPQNLFRIASISKPITSIAIMKLVEEKKLALDDKVFGPTGVLKNSYRTHPYKKDILNITIRHLLQHLSGGWGNGNDDPMFTDRTLSVEKLISTTLDSVSLTHPPGTRYNYSNFGYCVLGRVIEKVTGQSYENYVKNSILKPSGITDMQIGGNTLEGRKSNEVKYYGQGNDEPYIYNIERMDSHGGWLATANDLINLLAHVDGAPNVKDILLPVTIKSMITPPAISPYYASGWAVDTLNNWQHTGSLPGTRTELRKRSNGYGYAILLNTRSYDSAFSKGIKQLFEQIQRTTFDNGASFSAPLSTYKPAVFEDKDRLARLERVFHLIDTAYKEFALKNKIPGLAFGIVVDNKLVHSGAFGFSDAEKKTLVSTSSVYKIASMTKSFTGMAILKLRDEGKLNLNDPVSKYIPEAKNIQPLTGDSPPITIHHLLTHSAGFPEDNPWGDRQLQRTDEELIKFLQNGVSLSNIPGLTYEYSNLGFAMLGNIVSKVSGQHYEKYITEKIFRPLGMNSTYWEYADVPPQSLVNGYRLVNDKWEKEDMLHSGAYGAMGGLLTSVQDFSKYIALHISARPLRTGGDTAFIKRSTIREMHLPEKISGFHPMAKDISGQPCAVVQSYNAGLSWAKNCSGKEYIGHSGGLPGFGTHWLFLPEYSIGIVAFSNLTYMAPSMLNRRMLDTLISLAELKPLKLPSSDILNERKQQLLELLPNWKNAEKSGIFSENFFSDYFIDSLKKEATQLFDKAGKVMKIGEMIPDNQLRGSFIIEGEKTDIIIRFTLSPENPALIQQYIIREQPKVNNSYSKYKLKTIDKAEDYKKLVAIDKKRELVALDKIIQGITLDIRYATNNNLMKKTMYGKTAAYLVRPAAESLKAIQDELKSMGYGLKIFDGYRPYEVTVAFYETFHDSTFVASPYTGSRHNRGCAVDLTLLDLKTGNELIMPTPYDSFTKEAHSAFKNLNPIALKNRELLKRIMTKHGFQIYPDEWWHYDFTGWQQFPVLNIPFEMLD